MDFSLYLNPIIKYTDTTHLVWRVTNTYGCRLSFLLNTQIVLDLSEIIFDEHYSLVDK